MWERAAPRASSPRAYEVLLGPTGRLLWCVLKTNGTYKLQITASAGACSHLCVCVFGVDGVCLGCVYGHCRCWVVALVTMGQVMKFSVKGSGRTNYTRAATEIAHPSPAVNLTWLLEPFRLLQQQMKFKS